MQWPEILEQDMLEGTEVVPRMDLLVCNLRLNVFGKRLHSPLKQEIIQLVVNSRERKRTLEQSPV